MNFTGRGALISCSSGPRASGSLMPMGEPEARGPEEHERSFAYGVEKE